MSSTEGSKSGWHNKPPPHTGPIPLQNNVSMVKQLATALSLSTKNFENWTLTAQYRAEQFPKDFYVSGELLFAKTHCFC